MLMMLVMGFVPTLNVAPEYAYAQNCNPGETSGNIRGYAMTDHIGAIYMNTESWNADPLGLGNTPTSVYFSVSFDRQTGFWSGRGWNAHVGWVDFGEVDPSLSYSKQARFEASAANPQSWGGLEPIIDLSAVSYVNDPGGFVGLGTNGDYSISGGSTTLDTPVGARYVDFSNVILDLTVGDCNERVDILLNGVTTLYREQCPIPAPVIQWTTNDVTNCIATQGLWSGMKGVSGQELASGMITESNQPVTFRLSCTGVGSGGTVYGDAIASCGEVTGPEPDPGNPGGGTGPVIIDPTTGLPIPDFREV